MKTVSVKRSIEKDGLPKKDGKYSVEFLDGFSIRYEYNSKTKLFYFDTESNGCTPKFWYEEVELSTLIEEVIEKLQERLKTEIDFNTIKVFRGLTEYERGRHEQSEHIIKILQELNGSRTN